MIGFAKRAAKIVYGYDALPTAKGVKLMAVGDTASSNLRTGMERLAQKKNCPLVYVKALESKVGNNVKALGITDAEMAKAIMDFAAQGAPEYSIK